MTEQESFDIIDSAIESFKKKDGLHNGIKVSKTPRSDWLVFNWRQMTWKKHRINYLIEIYPKFDSNESITGWNLYAAASYDTNGRRYSLKKHFAENMTINEIAGNAEELFIASFKYLDAIKQEEIPFVVELS